MTRSVETVEFWCGTCARDTTFELVPVASETSPREWACLGCGAAYIEAFAATLEVEADVRGVA